MCSPALKTHLAHVHAHVPAAGRGRKAERKGDAIETAWRSESERERQEEAEGLRTDETKRQRTRRTTESWRKKKSSGEKSERKTGRESRPSLFL